MSHFNHNLKAKFNYNNYVESFLRNKFRRLLKIERKLSVFHHIVEFHLLSITFRQFTKTSQQIFMFSTIFN